MFHLLISKTKRNSYKKRNFGWWKSQSWLALADKGDQNLFIIGSPRMLLNSQMFKSLTVGDWDSPIFVWGGCFIHKSQNLNTCTHGNKCVRLCRAGSLVCTCTWRSRGCSHTIGRSCRYSLYTRRYLEKPTIDMNWEYLPILGVFVSPIAPRQTSLSVRIQLRAFFRRRSKTQHGVTSDVFLPDNFSQFWWKNCVLTCHFYHLPLECLFYLWHSALLLFWTLCVDFEAAMLHCCFFQLNFLLIWSEILSWGITLTFSCVEESFSGGE